MPRAAAAAVPSARPILGDYTSFFGRESFDGNVGRQWEAISPHRNAQSTDPLCILQRAFADHTPLAMSRIRFDSFCFTPGQRIETVSLETVS